MPVRTQYLVAALVAIIVLVGIWVTLGTYARTETARGILTTKAASAKVVAMRAGQVTELFAGEGDVVRAGQLLARVRTEQADEAGGSTISDSLAAIESQRRLAENR